MGQSGSRTRKATARAIFKTRKGRGRFAAEAIRTAAIFMRPVAAAPAQKKHRVITAPRLWWKVAAKKITKPRRFMLRGKKKRKSGESAGALPWRLPKPMSADEQMWADYRAFLAADMLHAWLEMYRDVLNLRPSFTEPIP